MELRLDPTVIALLALSLGLYWRAVRVLAGRGVEVPRRQQAAYYGGVFLIGFGLISPLGGNDEELLSAHMAEHLLIADIAAPLLLTGIRWPVYPFLLPRFALVPLARALPLRRLFRFLRRPLVAIPLFALVLYGWHISFLFEAAVRHDSVHALQHMTFIGSSILVWWAPLEPTKRRMPGELWKVGHIFAARLTSMFLGTAFVFMRHPAYTEVYGAGERDHGLSALDDQRYAGGMMMTLDIIIMFLALTIFFWRTASDHDRAEDADAERERAAAG